MGKKYFVFVAYIKHKIIMRKAQIMKKQLLILVLTFVILFGMVGCHGLNTKTTQSYGNKLIEVPMGINKNEKSTTLCTIKINHDQKIQVQTTDSCDSPDDLVENMTLARSQVLPETIHITNYTFSIYPNTLDTIIEDTPNIMEVQLEDGLTAYTYSDDTKHIIYPLSDKYMLYVEFTGHTELKLETFVKELYTKITIK